MSDLLLYQTSDSRFADEAVEALLQADIPCYRTGFNHLRGGLDPNISIFIEREHDYRRANDILIEVGGAVDGPVWRPSRGFVIVLAIAVLILAAAVAAHWK